MINEGGDWAEKSFREQLGYVVISTQTQAKDVLS